MDTDPPVSGDAMDLVERLRLLAKVELGWCGQTPAGLALAEAADEIERLRSQGGAPEGWAHVPAIGTYVEADHPITCLNPTKAFEVRFVDCVRGHWLVRGDNTCWFGVNSVKPATRENAIAAEEAAMLAAAPQPPVSQSAPDEFVLFPREPSEEILDALFGPAPLGAHHPARIACYRDAISAVSPPEGGPGWSSALSYVAAERQRQVSAEGWSAAHDDTHDKFEMSRAAAFYCLHTAADVLPEPDHDAPSDRYGLFLTADSAWPEAWSRHLWKKPKDARRNLVRAAALIIADIERLDRENEAAPPPGQGDRTNDGADAGDGGGSAMSADNPAANAAAACAPNYITVTTGGSKALPRKDVEGAALGDDLLTDQSEIARRTIAAVRSVMREDTACERIVPSDLRILIGTIDRLAASVSAERSRVIEACAAWHEDRAAALEGGPINPLTVKTELAMAKLHRESADAIREIGKQTGGADA